jgi:hypothetical protein
VESSAAPTDPTEGADTLLSTKVKTRDYVYETVPIARKPKTAKGKYRPPTEFPWENSFLSQIMAEIVLQLVNLYTTGKIAHFAATR